MKQRRYEFRTTPEYGDVIEAAAERKGIPVATWLRMVALEAANASSTQAAIGSKNE